MYIVIVKSHEEYDCVLENTIYPTKEAAEAARDQAIVEDALMRRGNVQGWDYSYWVAGPLEESHD